MSVRYRYVVEGQLESGEWREIIHYPMKTPKTHMCPVYGTKCAHDPATAEQRARDVLKWLFSLDPNGDWMQKYEYDRYARFEDFRLRRVRLVKKALARVEAA